MACLFSSAQNTKLMRQQTITDNALLVCVGWSCSAPTQNLNPGAPFVAWGVRSKLATSVALPAVPPTLCQCTCLPPPPAPLSTPHKTIGAADLH